MIEEQVFCNDETINNEPDGWLPPVYQKTEGERSRLKTVYSTNMLTKKVSEEDMNTLILATQKRPYIPGDTIIRFGDAGDEYFILEKGNVECEVYDPDTKEIIFSKVLEAGTAFGELALLYNAPRSATIKAKEDCEVWVLD